MIERLLAAERALAAGHLDRAEQLFRQVADADARNAIAVVGLAEVALARGDRAAAEALAARALAIDPDEAAAARLLASPRAEPVEPAAPGSAAGEGREGRAAGPSLGARLRRWLARLVGRGGRGG